jgi:hypothetical protein
MTNYVLFCVPRIAKNKKKKKKKKREDLQESMEKLALHGFGFQPCI